MKCPACERELAEIQVGLVRVDVCHGGCGGIWFDAFELKRVDEQHEAAGEPLTNIQFDPTIHVDAARKRKCPRCAGITLKRHRFSRGSKVEVDHCPNCAGYWLDCGELAQIRQEQHPGQSAPPGQRIQVDMEVIRYIYNLRIEQRQRL